MLNLSENTIKKEIETGNSKAFDRLKNRLPSIQIRRFLLSVLAVLFVVMFVPWTQNIRAKGYLTALRPDQRPQTLQSVIAGRIERWYVSEGTKVKKGDTILHISEVKEEYFDALLVPRTAKQVEAKEMAIVAYKDKIDALIQQVGALDETRKNKINQARNYLIQARLKVIADSADLEAARTQLQINQLQFERAETLFSQGLQPLNEYEARKQRVQDALARKTSFENRLLTSRNIVQNAEIELVTLENEYQEKMAKARSDLYTSESALYEAEGALQKLQNQLANYTQRSGLYWVLAPQDGVITKATKTGIGELIKEGEEIVSIAPVGFEMAVEMYVKPLDLPLMHLGQPVRFLFDGWPAVVFSGWPNVSFGTFGGRVVAIDNFASKNGLYRILITPDPNDTQWPTALRVGSGANGIALLRDVPVWYELWRQLNGFPADYYTQP